MILVLWSVILGGLLSCPYLTTSVQLPVILWHGMGDSCYHAGIQELVNLIRDVGLQVQCISTGKGELQDLEDTYFKPIDQQINQVCDELLADPMMSEGVHMIGLSQGGLFVRALAQRCPFKRLGSIISIGGPQMGVFGVPKCRDMGPIFLCSMMEKILSYAAYSDFAQKHLVQAQYWNNPFEMDQFYAKCHFLTDINQELRVNETYRLNLRRVKALVLVRFMQDTVLVPHISEWFGFYDRNSTTSVHTMKETILYTEDRLGLKELEKSNRLHLLQVDDDHLRFTREWFMKIIQQFLMDSP
ncbi:unnamed protein product [Dicrocoelium dendriticum]|nr:unnamed protein product [Dicrocoelium dendriticum]